MGSSDVSSNVFKIICIHTVYISQISLRADEFLLFILALTWTSEALLVLSVVLVSNR